MPTRFPYGFFLLFLGVFLLLPTNALAALISESVATPEGNNGLPLLLNNDESPNTFLEWNQSGELGSFEAYMYRQEIGSIPPDDDVRFYLSNTSGSGGELDCTTVSKPLSEWGIERYNFSTTAIEDRIPATPVLIDGFEGTECLIEFEPDWVEFDNYRYIVSSIDIGAAGSPSLNPAWFRAYDSTPDTVPPSTTLYGNQVVQYWPSAGVNDEPSEFTIGAQFSINDPSLIQGVGYRLYSPNGTVLYNATTTVDVAQTLSLTTDYDFTHNGLYTGQAYFIQVGYTYDSYGEIVSTDTWEIDSQVKQYIQITDTGTPPWTFNPDGSINPGLGTTTISSTTPLYLLNIQCGTGGLLEDPLAVACRIFNFIFNPDLQYVQQLRQNVGLIFTKFPFSIFTATYDFFNPALLTAAGSSSGGGTLVLNFYGSPVSILSPASLEKAGVDTDALAGIRLLITCGLWFLFLWYLFWRGTKLLDKFRRFI